MSNFPLLKLPYLCIEAVILNLSCHDIVIFSYISKKTCRLVKSFKSPVTSMRLYLEDGASCLNLEPMEVQWKKSNQLSQEIIEDINYFTSLFRCSVHYLQIDGDYLPEDNIDFGFDKLKKLLISGTKEINNDKLKYLLEQFEVTETIIVDIPISRTFYCDPKLFKAKFVSFSGGKSAGWITADFLSQLPREAIQKLGFEHPQFTIQDVVSVITEWFQFKVPLLKFLVADLNVPIEPSDLEDKCFKLMAFSPERRPYGFLDRTGEIIDFTSGLDIVRSDGQLATIIVEGTAFLFHVWSEDEKRSLSSS
ncbi:unnamed protein product [Caenorhabditis brenneri]